MTSVPAKLLIITIDVEAGPHLQSAEHVERLIWGKFGDQSMGIGRMMEIAERCGRKLTFFLDYCETLTYPGEFERISQYISGHGHNIQLHAHTQFLTDDFWKDRGLPPLRSGLDQYDKPHAEALMEFLAQCALKMGGKAAVAFRGGAFRYNHAVLDAMIKNQLRLSFNYNVRTPHQFNNERNRGVFRWSNGVIEIPMSYAHIREELREFEFSNTSATDFGDQALVQDYMKQFYAEFGESAVLVMLMHSWSLLYREPKEPNGFYYEFKDQRLAQNFEQFLSTLPDDVQVVTASELDYLIQQGLLRINASRAIEEVGPGNPKTGSSSPIG